MNKGKIDEADGKGDDKYRLLFENASDEILYFSPTGICLEANNRIKDLFGIEPAEVIGRRFTSFLPYTRMNVGNMLALFKSLFDPKKPLSRFEIEGIHKDGRSVFVEVQVTLVRKEGEIDGILVNVRDLAERKKAEAALSRLEDNERLISCIVETAKDCIFVKDSSLHYVKANSAMASLLGMSREEIVGETDTRLFGADNAANIEAVDRRVLAGETVEEYPARPVKGEVRHFHTIKVPIKDAGGRATGLFGIARDITEYKLAETALKEKEERFRKLIQNSSDISVILDREGNEVYVSDSVERITGFRPDECIGRNSFTFAHQDDMALLAESFAGLLSNPGKVLKGEYRHRTKEGGWVWLEAIGTNWLDDPIIKGIVLNVRDITQRKNMEVALRASEKRFREVIEGSQDILYRQRVSDAVLEFMSPSVFPVLGYTPDEMYALDGTKVNELFHPDDLPILISFKDDLIAAAAGGARFIEREFRMIAKSGRVRWIHGSYQLAMDADGNPEYIVGTLKDVTERRQAEEDLRKSEALYRLLSEHTTDNVWLADMNLKTTYNSPSVAKLRGFTTEEVESLPLERHLTPASYKAAREVFEREKAKAFADPRYSPVCSLDLEFYKKDGSTIWVETKCSLIRDESGRPVSILGEGRDITEWKKNEEEKARLVGQLQQAMKMEAVGRLAGGVAHDFNNLLTGIKGNISLALMDLNPADPLHDTLTEMEKAADSAASLTRQLLAFSRKQMAEPRVVDLNELVGNLNKMLVRLIGEDVDLKIVQGKDLPAVKLDPVQFEQVLINLAVNARDAMPEGGEIFITTSNANPDEGLRRAHPLLDQGAFVLLSVSDTGQGMSEEVKSHLFEPFFTTKPLGRGTGLGLATIYGVVMQAGGAIEVDSEAGKGTTFRIYLPAVREKADKPEKTDKPRELKGGNETILLVEDEPMVRSMAIKVLKLLGYNVLHAEDGGKALIIAEEFKTRIDLLVTDVIMPGINGRQLADRLNAIHPEMKVLFTSGYTDDILTDRGVTRGGLNFIGKPYSPQSMANKIREVLDGKEPLRAHEGRGKNEQAS